MKTKNKAFTLAETLVVMGIIGVIAALTIPNLSQSTGNREKVTKVKKAYAQLSEAFDRAQAIYGPYDEWYTSADSTASAQVTKFGDRLTEFMKVSKNCKVTTNQDCFGKTETTNIDTSANVYKFILADGIRVSLHSPAYKTIDINISKAQSVKHGTEVFVFYTKDNQVQPLCNELDTATLVQKNFTTVTQEKYNCAAKWILDYDNMDYLKKNDDWECPNGRVLNLTANPPVTSCN